MDAVELFTELVAQRAKTCAGQYAGHPAFRQLCDTGLIEEAGVAQSICCDDCDQPHDAAIVYEDGQYGYYCPDLGFVPKHGSELAAITPNIQGFVEDLADDLNCKRRKSKPISGNTWRIGAIETHAGDIAVYFHPVLQDAHDLNDLKSALASEVSSPFGIVITTAGELNVAPYITVSLQNTFRFNRAANQFNLDVDIETIVGVPQINTGGRPNEYRKNIEKIMIMRNQEGRAVEGRNAEAKGVQSEYKTRFPNRKVPSLSGTKRYVTEIRSGS